MATEVGCGCRISTGGEIWIEDHHEPAGEPGIVFCNMHAAAKIMLQALIKVSKFSTWDFVEDAIAKARGEYKNG